jgi:hypothetical protein
VHPQAVPPFPEAATTGGSVVKSGQSLAAGQQLPHVSFPEQGFTETLAFFSKAETHCGL